MVFLFVLLKPSLGKCCHQPDVADALNKVSSPRFLVLETLRHQARFEAELGLAFKTSCTQKKISIKVYEEQIITQ